MRRSFILAAALATAALAPAAFAAPGSGPGGEAPPHARGERGSAPDRPAAPDRLAPDRDAGPEGERAPEGRGPSREGDEPGSERARYVLHGVVATNARRAAVQVEVVRANARFREALAAGDQEALEAPTPEGDAAEIVHVVINGRTKILVRRPAEREGSKPRSGQRASEARGEGKLHKAGHRALRTGDPVTVVWIAPPDLGVEDLPAARMITDLGRAGELGRGPSGAAFTTNDDGTAVNLNHYASADDVFLNGGPSCGAQRHAGALPDGTYYFQVTTPNGRELLSTSPLEDREFVMEDSVVVSSTAPSNPLGCDEDGLVVKVAPFAASHNGVYKLWIAPSSAVEDGVFSRRQSKTDNFKIDLSSGDQDPDPDPGPSF